MPEQGVLVHKPPQVSYEQAAALAFGGTTALDFFRRAALRAGERVLVNGATGTVGSAMVQVAADAGAEVTAVGSGCNAELVHSLGATRVIDYRQTDFAAEGARYDVIVDTVGNAPYVRAKHALRPRGRLLLVLATLPELLRAPWVSLTTGHRVIAGPAAERLTICTSIVRMAEGRFTPLIDCCVPFAQIVAGARAGGERPEARQCRGAIRGTVNAAPAWAWVAVWNRRPSAREPLDARLVRGWQPTATAPESGDRTLGSAACIVPAEHRHRSAGS
jgi:NADPH:quinone reductase-like Zn-dependent oxidoreductase